LPENAAGELSAVLPRAVLEAIDIGSLALVHSDELVDRWLDTRFRDARFRTSFRGVTGYIWFLVEHQSAPDDRMVLRVLDYLVRSWMELLRLEPNRKTLPPVVCVIVHHGESGECAETSARARRGCEPGARASCARSGFRDHRG
jgi:predicted transposase YdaD